MKVRRLFLLINCGERKIETCRVLLVSPRFTSSSREVRIGLCLVLVLIKVKELDELN